MRNCAKMQPLLKQNTASTFVGGNTQKSHIAVTKDSRIDKFGLARARALHFTSSGTSKTHFQYFLGGNTQKSHIAVTKDSRIDNLGLVRARALHLTSSGTAVFTSFWAQHGPFEGRDTCESLSGFHIVLGVTWAM